MYTQFIFRNIRLTNNMMSQEFLQSRSQIVLYKFYSRYNYLVTDTSFH
jgi:hypothetical protein